MLDINTLTNKVVSSIKKPSELFEGSIMEPSRLRVSEEPTDVLIDYGNGWSLVKSRLMLHY